MATVEGALIHQALFGYNDGHKLLETSIRLSSQDLYELSALSDLASGVQLRGDESYLTGITLQDSRHFVLIRTWSAPEMPRPGCVWSHVLILTTDILASQRDLSILDKMFRRPVSVNLTGIYSQAVNIPRHEMPIKTSSKLVGQVMRSYYTSQSFNDPAATGPDLQSAVLVMWSQQWPRLRAASSFRTARVTSGSNRPATRFDFQPGSRSDHIDRGVGLGDEVDTDWIDAAVADAISTDVTPLRRFLWRYGKDIRSPKQRFQNLVKIHLATRKLKPNGMPLSWAQSIVSLFPGPDNATTIKRDMLGFEPTPLTLCTAVAIEDILEILPQLLKEGIVIANETLEARLSEAQASAVPALAASVVSHGPELLEQAPIVMRVLTKIADERSVSDTRVPPEVRLTILQTRHELISAGSLAAMSDNDLLKLFEIVEQQPYSTRILDTLLRRDIAQYPDALVEKHANQLLVLAITARSDGVLSHGASTFIRNQARRIISKSALIDIAGSSMAAQAADLLNYPVDRELADDVPKWLSALERCGPDAEGQALVNFEAYMLVVATRSQTSAGWELLKQTLSRVRSVVLAGGLVNPAYELLNSQLPHDGWNSWDLHKRILIALRDLRRFTRVDRAEVMQLDLADDDLSFVLDERKSKREKGGFSSWFWD